MYDYNELVDENIEKYRETMEIYENYHNEHHYGRLTSIKKILQQIQENEIDGDIVEFGSWQGQSFYNIINIMENLVLNKKIIGIDCFEGIPSGYGHENCPDKLFKDTSYDICVNNIIDKTYHCIHQKNNWSILKSFFNETDKILSFLKEKKISKISFIHLDCDVVKSCEEALQLLINNELLNETWFVHFDDWGIKTGIPEWFDNYSTTVLHEYNIVGLYQTNLTKSFICTKNNI